MSKTAMKLALEALEGIHRYGLDTLSGRSDGPDDRDWQRAGVNEMTKRARLGITAMRRALEQPAQQELVGVEWTPCMKLPVVVHVRKQRPGESHVSTREGITPVKPDDLIMRGVSGEEYPIGRVIFEQTYSLDTSPPAQRKPLTDEQFQAICNRLSRQGGWDGDGWDLALKEAIEAAHGIFKDEK